MQRLPPELGVRWMGRTARCWRLITTMPADALSGTLITALALAVAFGVGHFTGLARPWRVALMAVVLGASVLGWGRVLGEADQTARHVKAIGEGIALFRPATNALDARCKAGQALDAGEPIAEDMRFAPARGDAHAVLSVRSATQAHIVITVDATTRSGGRRAVFEGACTAGERVQWQVGTDSTVAPEALTLLP